ncbi:MAG: stage II sporulation protein P [Limnochordales bacterium]|nr:stage II sporulation protein P [Limnochordales bacterium]
MKPARFGLILSLLVVTLAGAVLRPAAGSAASGGNGTSGRESEDERQIPDEWWERREGGYYTVRDGTGGQVLTYTTLELRPGDIYVSSDNVEYEVERVVGDEIFMIKKGNAQLPPVDDGLIERLRTELKAEVSRPITRQSPLVGIYFTHSAESYRPTSGTPMETPRGDVYQVGEALARGLRRQGIRVEVREETHVPHDGLAYHRSRATVRKLLAEMPALLIDIHRDAVPANIYLADINGRKTARVRIVVGRQNPQAEANFDLARRLKAVADRLFPGLVLDVFFGHGNYNQDVAPQSVLLEFGTTHNSLDQAMVAAELFSKVIPAAAGLAQVGQTRKAPAGQRYAWVALILLAVVGGGLLFFYWLNRLPQRR